jgi:hypothetical protein
VAVGSRSGALEHLAGEAPKLLRELRPEDEKALRIPGACSGCGRDAIQFVDQGANHRRLVLEAPECLKELQLDQIYERCRHRGPLVV